MTDLTSKAIEAARTMSTHIVPSEVEAKVEAGLVEGDRISMGAMLSVYEGNGVIRVTRDDTEVFHGPATPAQLEQMLMIVAANAGRRGSAMGAPNMRAR